MSAADTVAGEAPAADSVTAAASELLQATVSRLRNTLELAAAEARLAAMSGLLMLVLVALTVCFVLVGWGLIVAALANLAVSAGLSWTVVAGAAGLAHLLAAGLLLSWALRLSRHLTLPTLRQALGAGDTATSR